MPALEPPAADRSLMTIRPEILRYAWRVLGSWDDAEDAVQAAQAKAWRCRARWTSENFRPWLFLMTKRACLDLLKRQARQVPVSQAALWSEEVSEHYVDPAPTAEERLLAGCLSEAAARAVAALPGAGMRAAVRLVYVQGLSVEDAARLLGVSRHAIAMHTWKARRLLRAALAGATTAQDGRQMACGPAGVTGGTPR